MPPTEHSKKRKTSEIDTEEERFDSKKQEKSLVNNSSEDDESSESESEDSDADLVTENIDSGIKQVLTALKSGSDKLKDPSFRFFDDPSQEVDVKKPKEKPVYLKDYQRQRYLEDGADAALEEEPSLAPVDAERKAKSDLISAFHNSDSDDNDELLSKRTEQREIPDVELPDPTKDGEGFLNAFLDNKGWLQKGKDKLPTYKEIVDDDEEDEEITDMFENAYNFRYEDPNAAEIVSYARDQNTLRRGKLSSRQKKRLQEGKQKEHEKEMEKLELAKLKKSKVTEVTDKLQQLHEALGEGEDRMAELLANEDLDKDWDDKDWDKRMQKLFDDEFYNQEDADAAAVTKKELKRKAEQFVENNEDLIRDQQIQNTGFRYREVDAESFGLTARDILLASDKDLNKFAGLKKLASYRDAEHLARDKKRLMKSKNLRQWRREVFGTEDVTDELWEKAKKEAELEFGESEKIKSKKDKSKKKHKSKGKK